MNVNPTAKIIDDMAATFRRSADELNKVAKNLRESKDLTYVAEAIGVYTNLGMNLRLNLLLTRPIKALLKEKK